jgi:hypothetical protein
MFGRSLTVALLPVEQGTPLDGSPGHLPSLRSDD